MLAYRISSCEYINDLSGFGAFMHGGRWNSEGQYALYTGSTASLALLEILAHLQQLPPKGLCIVCLKVPDEFNLVFDSTTLPKDWNVYPAPLKLQEIGNQLLKQQKYLSIEFPSVLLPEDKVILLNPKHPKFSEVTIEYTRQLDIDKRLYKMK